MSGQDQTTEQVQATAAGKSSWRAFKPQAALKPPYLEKESSHLEDGYNGVPDGTLSTCT